MIEILDQLKESQDFGDLAGVKKQVVFVRVSKPKKHQFVRVRPGPEWTVTAAFLEDSEAKDLYFVDKKIVHSVQDEISTRTLHTAITKEGDVFLWPVKIDKNVNRPNSWNVSAREAVEIAKNSWIRVKSNTDNGVYDTLIATGSFSDPIWPELSFKEIINLAFKDRVIRDVSHPILKKLRGDL